MKLFLAAQGDHPETISRLEREVGQPLSGKKIAFIPTAGNSKDGPGAWRAGERYKNLQKLDAHITVVELEGMTRKQVHNEVLGADILWVGGGQPGYLLYWMRRHYLDELLTDLFNNKSDLLYVGSSAGSMIFSEKQTLAQWEINGEIPERDVFPGLGLLDFEVFPHYDDHLLSQITMMWTQGDLWLLKNGEVILADKNGAEVLGEKRVLSK